MNDSPEAQAARKSRLRWITLGEAVAIAALIVSAAGVWISWKSSSEDKGPTRIVEQRQAVPLTLRGKVQDDGRSLEISPVEEGHALQSLVVTVANGKTIETSSDGVLRAGDVEDALGEKAADGKGIHRVRVNVAAQYVEAGADKSTAGSYVISFRWEGGGLLGGRSLRLLGLSRA
jgi:hypothetical protein